MSDKTDTGIGLYPREAVRMAYDNGIAEGRRLERERGVQARYHNEGGIIVLDDVPVWMIGPKNGYVLVIPLEDTP